MRAVAEAMIERVDDQIALDIGNRAADETARRGGGGFDGRLHRARQIRHA